MHIDLEQVADKMIAEGYRHTEFAEGEAGEGWHFHVLHALQELYELPTDLYSIVNEKLHGVPHKQ